MHMKKVINVHIVGVCILLYLMLKYFHYSLSVFCIPHPAYPLSCRVFLRAFLRIIVLVLQIRKLKLKSWSCNQNSPSSCVVGQGNPSLSDSMAKSFVLIEKSRFPPEPPLLGRHASFNGIFLRKRWAQLYCINPSKEHVVHSNHLSYVILREVPRAMFVKAVHRMLQQGAVDLMLTREWRISHAYLPASTFHCTQPQEHLMGHSNDQEILLLGCVSCSGEGTLPVVCTQYYAGKQHSDLVPLLSWPQRPES